jgi:hypothetical protein
MNIAELKKIYWADANKFAHEFWDECGMEVIALWEACEKHRNQLPLSVLSRLDFLSKAAADFVEPD